MTRLMHCVLANRSHKLPMPDRDYQLFPQTEDGLLVDVEKPFYLRALNDGSILKHPTPTASGPPETLEQNVVDHNAEGAKI